MEKLITIENEELLVTLDAVGAVFHSIQANGLEYLWQGDPTYWKRRDAILFPYVGRLTEGVYTYKNKRYELSIHGFCIGREFQVAQQRKNSVTFVTHDDEQTREHYPFRFTLRITYTLNGNQIIKAQTVKNESETEMIFGLGAHPGFQVPLNKEGTFEDWYFEFPEACEPYRIELDPVNYRFSGKSSAYPLKDKQVIPLTHSLFDFDAVVFSNIPHSITLRSTCSNHSVTMDFPGMDFLGLWHAPKTDAGYVCIEPWASLPSHSSYIEDLETQEHLIHLPSGAIYENVITTHIK